MISQKKNPGNLLGKVTIEGLVELGAGGKVAVVTEPDSRSRVSYYIKGELGKELEEYLGSIVKVSGTVTGETSSKWSKHIEITSYQVVIDNNPKAEKKAFWKFWLWFS